MTPKEFSREYPKAIDDLLGNGASVARVVIGRVKSGDVQPIQLLCHGDPGIGKTATCRIIANAIAEHPVHIRRVSARLLTEDHMRDWMHDLHYIADQWRVYWVEEVDLVNPAVAGTLLQFLDDMPVKTAALFTSNEAMSGLEGRFQSRCEMIRFERPGVLEVEALLKKHWPELGDAAREIRD